MSRFAIMVRNAVAYAPIWGDAWALEHIRIALQGEADSATWERGRRANRLAWLGSRIVTLRERMHELIKLARRTPPRTLLAERRRVAEAGAHLERCWAEFEEMATERLRLAAVEARATASWESAHLRSG